MEALEEIRQIIESHGDLEWYEGTASQTNVDMDKMGMKDKFEINPPFVSRSTLDSVTGREVSVFDTDCYFLRQLYFPTTDYKESIVRDAVSDMERLAKWFVNKIISSQSTVIGTGEWITTEERERKDPHLFGVKLTIRWSRYSDKRLSCY